MRTSDSKPSSTSRLGSSDITFVMMDNPSPLLAEDWIGGLTHSLLISMRSRFGYCVVSVPVLFWAIDGEANPVHALPDDQAILLGR